MSSRKRKLVVSEHIPKDKRQQSIRVFGKIKKKGAESVTAEQTIGTEKPEKRLRLDRDGSSKARDCVTVATKTKGKILKTVGTAGKTKSIPRDVKTVNSKVQNKCLLRATLEDASTVSSRRANKARVSCWNDAYINCLNKTSAKATSKSVSRGTRRTGGAKGPLGLCDGNKTGSMNCQSVDTPGSDPGIRQDGRSRSKKMGQHTAETDSGIQSGRNIDRVEKESPDQKSIGMTEQGQSKTMEDSFPRSAAPSISETGQDQSNTIEQDSMFRSAAPSTVETEQQLLETKDQDLTRSSAPSVADAETQTCGTPDVVSDLSEDVLVFLLNKKLNEFEKVVEPLLEPVIAACTLVRDYIATGQCDVIKLLPPVCTSPVRPTQGDSLLLGEEKTNVKYQQNKESDSPSGNSPLAEDVSLDDTPDESRDTSFLVESGVVCAASLLDAATARDGASSSLGQRLMHHCHDDELHDDGLSLTCDERCCRPETVDAPDAVSTMHDPLISGADLYGQTRELLSSPVELSLDEMFSSDLQTKPLISPIDFSVPESSFETLSTEQAPKQLSENQTKVMVPESETPHSTLEPATGCEENKPVLVTDIYRQDHTLNVNAYDSSRHIPCDYDVPVEGATDDVDIPLNNETPNQIAPNSIATTSTSCAHSESVLQMGVHNLDQPRDVSSVTDTNNMSAFTKTYVTSSLDGLALNLGLNKSFHKMKVTVVYPQQLQRPEVDVTVPPRKPLRRPRAVKASPHQFQLPNVDVTVTKRKPLRRPRKRVPDLSGFKPVERE